MLQVCSTGRKKSQWMEDDGQDVLITVYGGVEVDTFIRDEVDECYFENRDIGDVKAWMPLPPAWKGENNG